MYKLLTKILTILYFIITPSQAISSAFYPKEHIVIDLSRNIEWLRCSVGLQWNGETCVGKTMLMNHKTIEEAIKIADEQLGPSWR